MGYVPKFIHLDHFIVVNYPFGVYWKHGYIQQSAEAIFNTYKEDIGEGTSITFVARGTSGAMIAGAMLNELHNIDPTTKTYILIVRKEEDKSAHCSSLQGIGNIGTTKFIVVDLFNHYEPSIDIIVQGKRYRVLLWYNSYKSNYPNKPIVVRNYIQLFVI